MGHFWRSPLARSMRRIAQERRYLSRGREAGEHLRECDRQERRDGGRPDARRLFAVYEDGRPQQIAVFERQSELPLNLTLAIDTSGSVRKDMSEEAGAARRFAHAILRPQDQMSVLQFATEVRELTPFTNKPSADRPRSGRVAQRLGIPRSTTPSASAIVRSWAEKKDARCWW
jgi:Mg-chelatase subunit ChlD